MTCARPPQRRWRPIGLLGGAGPWALAQVHNDVVATAAAAGCGHDEEYPPVLVHSLPTLGVSPTGTLAAGDGLAQGLAGLAAAGAEVIGVACNSVHTRALPVPTGAEVVPVTTAVMAALGRRDAHVVGVIASRQVADSALYDAELTAAGYQPLRPPPADQAQLDAAIWSAMQVRPAAEWQPAIRRVLDGLLARGAHVVIAGCTELRIDDYRVIDSGRALAQLLLDRARQDVTAVAR